jgi:steroid 5-alpha reductase family enzyme
MLTLSLTCLGAVLALFFILWLVSLAVRDASIVDMVWGAGFVVIAWIAFFIGDGAPPRRILMAVMVTLWGSATQPLFDAAEHGQG